MLYGISVAISCTTIKSHKKTHRHSSVGTAATVCFLTLVFLELLHLMFDPQLEPVFCHR